MDTERLIQIITEEVRRFLEESSEESVCECPRPALSGPSIQDGGNLGSSPARAPQPASPFGGQKVLCLVSGEIEQESEFLAAVQDLSLSGIAIEALVSDRVDRAPLEKRGIRILASPSELGPRYENLKSYQAVLLPSLDRTFAAKIALGITDEDLAKVTVSALFYGVPVLAAQEQLLTSSRIAQGNKLRALADRVSQYRADLERMGVLIVPMKEMVSRARYTARVVAPGSGEVITHLITFEDAKNLPGPVVRVARGGLVTAMARELLTQRGIQIEIVGS